MQAPKARPWMRLAQFLLPLLLIAGCGDGPVAPDLPISVALTPAGPVSLYVGDTVTVHAAVANAARPEVTYGTSNAAVVSVSPTGLMTALSAGTATITATSVADPGRSASVQVQVQPSASLLIEQVLNSTGSQPLDPSHVQGLIFVQLAVERANAARLEVLLDTAAVECQSFSAPAAGPTPSSLKCGFNTAAFDSLTGTPRLRNGTARVSARLVASDGRVLHTVVGQQVVLANPNMLVTRLAAPRQAVDASGLRWIDGDVTVTALPVLFEPSATLARVEFSYRSPAGATTVLADTAAPFTATFRETRELDGITDPDFQVSLRTATTSGASGPAGTTSAVRYDNEPPHPGVLVPRAWFGANTPFTAAYDATKESDAGVGRSAARFFAGDPVLSAAELIKQGKQVVRGSDLPRALFDSYRLAANVCDALENCTLVTGFTFGIDLDPPIVDRISIPDSAVNPLADLTVDERDDLSGIGSYAMEATATMLDARASLPVCGPTVEGRKLPGRVLKGACIADSLGFTAPVPRTTAGYYTYAITPLDRAGNRGATILRRILVDSAKPVIGAVSYSQQLVSGDDMSVQVEAADNLDLVRIGAQLVFPNETRSGGFAVPFVPDTAIGAAFDNVLTTAATATRRFPFVRTLTYAASGPLGARATVLVDSLQLRAVDAAGQSATSNRLLSRTSFGNDTSTADPFPTLSSAASTVDRVVVCTAACGAGDPTSVTVTLRVVDESISGGLPFARVYFYRRAADGSVALLGPPTSASSTVQTSTQRTITYTYPFTPPSGLTGSYTLFAVGVTSRGSAMATAVRPGANNTVQFFGRTP